MSLETTPDAARSEDFSAFDHHAKDIRVGAESLWARMRACPALAYSEKHGGFHVVANYADLQAAALDWATYSSAAGITLPEAQVRSLHIPTETDPPVQREYRAVVSRFTAKEQAKAMEGAFRALAVGLLEGLKGRTHFDFSAAFARPLPVHAAMALLGLPAQDADLLDALVMEMHQEVATGVRTGGAAKLTQYVEDAVNRLKPLATDPEADILSAILLGQVEGRPLRLEEQVSMIRLLLIGGFDTTAFAISTAMWWLAQNPDQAQRLRDDPALLETASEEFVRWVSPASYLRRTVTCEAELGGSRLHPGDRILLAFGAANRDPAQFDRPEEVVLDRSPNHHAGFGFGAHRCIGSHVAKLEIVVALEEVLKRYKAFRLDPTGEVRWSSGLNQGVSALPLIVEEA